MNSFGDGFTCAAAELSGFMRPLQSLSHQPTFSDPASSACIDFGTKSCQRSKSATSHEVFEAGIHQCVTASEDFHSGGSEGYGILRSRLRLIDSVVRFRFGCKSCAC